MISVNLCGGLGNQLFQIFTVIAYSLEYKVPFTFPKHKFDQQKRRTYWDNGEMFSSLRVFLTNGVNDYLRYREPYFQFHPLPQPIERPRKICLDGYFQSYKYFDRYFDDICKLIGFEDKLKRVEEIVMTNFKKKFGDNMKNKNFTFISMHFRLGDYKHLQQHHNLLPDLYYYKAIMAIITHLKKGNNIENKKIRILYFCEKEDLPVVKYRVSQLFNKLIPTMNKDIDIDFIHVNDTFNDWQQMLLMSMCHHNIIANSSYSWWAAYFNKNPTKFVTYPPVWFGPTMANKDTSDLCPKNWHKIKL